MITNIDDGVTDWSYRYDSLYRLIEETSNAVAVGRWEYDPAGNRTLASNAAGRIYCAHDLDDELIGYTENTSAWITVTGEVEAGPASNKWYDTWATAVGRTARVSTNDGSFAIEGVPVIEGTNQLTVTVTDASGNSSNRTVTFRKESVSGNVLSYDGNGNLVTNIGASATNVYAYDMENRLVSASSNGAAVLECWYDGAGRRVAKREVVGGVTNEVMYVYSGWTVLAVLDSSGEAIEYYTRGGGIAGDIGSIVAVTTNMAEDAALYVHGNHRGDVTAVRSGTETSATYAYTPYGEARGATGGFAMRYRFSTKELDEATGLYYFGYRYYDLHLGRFTTADPIREGGGLNSYTFCADNPVNFCDPDGLLTHAAGVKVEINVPFVQLNVSMQVTFTRSGLNPLDWRLGFGGSWTQPPKPKPTTGYGVTAGCVASVSFAEEPERWGTGDSSFGIGGSGVFGKLGRYPTTCGAMM